MKITLTYVPFLLATALSAQPLAQEQFLIGPAGSGYKADLNIASIDQNKPITASGLTGWYGYNNTDDTGGTPITNRLIPHPNTYLHTQPVAGSVSKGSLAFRGGKLSVANGGNSYYGGLNLSASGPFAGYLTEGQSVGSTDTGVLYVSFLYQLNNLNVGANQNLVRLVDTVNPQAPTFDNNAQVFIRNAAERYVFGQQWGSSTFSAVGTTLENFNLNPHLIVLKIEYKAGSDTVTTYYDPDITQPESANTPQSTSNRDMRFSAVTVIAQQATALTTGFMFDELRFGSTWESVLPSAATYTFTLVEGEHGSVQQTPAGASFLEGSEITLTATPADGYRFKEWTGDIPEADRGKPQIVVILDGNKTVQPVFEPIPSYSITVTIEPEGAGEVEITPPPPVVEGTEVELFAAPAEGYKFSGWTIGALTSSKAAFNYTVVGDTTVVARFTSTAITLDATAASFPAEGGQASIQVTTGIVWQAVRELGKTWVTLNSGTSGTGNGSITYTVAANSTTSPRTATITVRENNNNANNVVYAITQAGKAEPVPSILTSCFFEVGTNFRWNPDIGYIYEGFFPFIWIYDAGNWFYLLHSGATEQGGYYLYDFGRNQWGFSGCTYYPNYVLLPLSDPAVLVPWNVK